MSKLLYLNLAIDSEDTSLGFAIGWLEEISKNYESVDVITLRLGKLPILDKKINIYGPTYSTNKLTKYRFLYKTAKKLINKSNYDRCFSHMSPISIFVIALLLKSKNIKTTLWFTHPGPKFGIKKLILFISSKLSSQILTASSSSFPFESKKVHIIGHAVNLEYFQNNKSKFELNNFLILSRISQSKNLETSIDAFLKSNFRDKNLDIIGGPLNRDDEEYLKKLELKYSNLNNVNFLGKAKHIDLPTILEKYDINFNSAGEGFYDKSVLETLSMGIINFYHNPDFDNIYNNYSENYYFNDSASLTLKINLLENLKYADFNKFFAEINKNLNKHSLSTLNERLSNII
ncbi:MAG: glycosyltransferase [Flavobacteriaceae bacterium TMED238]|nr:MAG: glycosyltransferase [Flavobacteriaceae bacterium TMED238]